MDFKSHHRVLLTGAGFSNAFDAYLTSQIWEHTFNQPEIARNPILRDTMLNQSHDLSYEIIYDVLRNEGKPHKEFEPYLTALGRVFSQIDEILRRNLGPDDSAVNRALLFEWLQEFRGSGEDKGFIFTANHDLFLERFFGAYTHGQPTLPGVPEEGQPSSVSRTCSIEKLVVEPKPHANDIQRLLSNLNVVKLHGSSNWNYPNGNTTMITGVRKDQQISSGSLFDVYAEIFKKALCSPATQLWVIGYGFGDININRAISDGVKKGLSVNIVDLADPKDLLKHIAGGRGLGSHVRGAVHGYIRNSLKGVFQKNSIPLKEINTLMGNQP